MCTRTKIETQKIRLADIYDQHFDQYLYSKNRKLILKNKHLKAVNQARACGTDKLGIAVFACTSCGDTTYITRSCKNRFCAKCGAADTIKWAKLSLTRLLNIKHHHIVTTLPKPLRFLARINGPLIYNLLFQTSAAIIKSWFEAKHNIRPGIVAVLHTSGSDLKFHPHIHMVVSGGGQLIQSGKYKILESDFLCAQAFLGRQLKIKFQCQLIKLFNQGKLKVPKRIDHPKDFSRWLWKMDQKHWIVSIQKPLNDIHHIVGYVGRYTKRACLSEYKIESIGSTIKFKFNDYKNTPRGEKPRQAIKELKPIDFLDQLLQHVPDKGYRMVRYYGLYNSRYLKSIPDHLKAESTINPKATLAHDEHFDWGEFEQFRKAFIAAGLEDPLFCKACNQSKVLIGIKFKDKFINTFEYDSS